MPRLNPSVNCYRTTTAPVLVLREGIHAVEVMARVTTGEGGPDEVAEIGGQEGRVVADNNHRYSVR